MSRGQLIVLSSVSGAGKTTLQERVLPLFPNLKYSISATTRAPRKGEVDGVHYHFLSVEKFQKLIERDELVEWMEVHGNFYGTPKAYLEKELAQGHHLLLDLDVKGKLNFDRIYPKAVGIFVMVPDMETLEKRLRLRSSDSEETIQLRLRNAQEELKIASEMGKYEYWLVNDEIDKAVAEFIEIISKTTGELPLPLSEKRSI
jgi:guanylate kinase